MAHWSIPPLSCFSLLLLSLFSASYIDLNFYLSIGPYLFLFFLRIFLFSPLVLTSFAVFCFGDFLLPVHRLIPPYFNTFPISDSLSHWTVPPFLFSLLLCCLWFYYITFPSIVNTFFKKSFNYFIFHFSIHLF